MLNKHGRMAMPDVKKNGRCRIQQKQKFKQSTLLCQGKMNVDRILNFCYRKKIRLCQGVNRRFVLCIFSCVFETFPSERCKMSVTIQRRTTTSVRSFVCLFVCMYVCMFCLFANLYDPNTVWFKSFFSFIYGIYDSGIIFVWLFPKPRTSCTMVQHEAIGSSQSGLESL